MGKFIELKVWMKEYAQDASDPRFDEARRKLWLERFRHVLPSEEFPVDFIKYTLHSYRPEYQSYVYELLAALGCEAVTPYALAHLDNPANKEDQLFSAKALAMISNPKGIENLRVLSGGGEMADRELRALAMSLVADPQKAVLPLRARMKVPRKDRSSVLQEVKESLQDTCDGEYDACADYDTTPDAIKWLTQRLPKEPLPPEFLEEVLAPFVASNQINAILLLAKMGRHEVEPFALNLLEQDDERIFRLDLAQALAYLSNSKGFEIIEKMAHERLAKPDSEDTCPFHWFTSFLEEELPDVEAAQILLQKLKALKQ